MAIESLIRRMFPEVHHNDGQPLLQMKRIQDEYEELFEAATYKDDREEVLREGVDVIHSAFNTLYKFGFSDIDIYRKIIEVRKHNEERGYYKKSHPFVSG